MAVKYIVEVQSIELAIGLDDLCVKVGRQKRLKFWVWVARIVLMSLLDTGSTKWVTALFSSKEAAEFITILVFDVLSGQSSEDAKVANWKCQFGA